MYKKGIGILLVIIMMFSLAGCGKSIPGIFSNDDKEYEESNVINFCITNIKTLNPVVSDDEDTYYISKLIYQSLFELDETLTPQPELVADYSVSDDGKTLILKLNGDAKFSDGKKVGADDVAFSIGCYKAAGDDSIYYENVKGIESVSVKGDNKINIVYNSDGIGMIKNLTFPILPKHLYSETELLIKDSSFIPKGSGSYRVKTYKNGEKLVLTANKKTNGDVPSNRLVFNITNKAKVLNLAEGNLVSLIVNRNPERQTEVGSKSLKTIEINSDELETVGFNCDKGLMNDKNLRKAVAYSIDIDDILSKAYYNSAVKTDSIFYPGYLNTGKKADSYKLDKKKTESLLDDADIKDTDKDGYLNKKDGGNIKLTIVISSNNSTRREAARMIQEDLKQIDIDSEIVSLSKSAYKARLKKGDYDIFVGGFKFADYYSLKDMIGGKNDFTGYRNSELKSLVSRFDSCASIDEMVETLGDIKKILKDDLPYYPICYKTYAVICSNELTGEIEPMFNDIYRGCEDWYCKYEISETVSDEEEDSGK